MRLLALIVALCFGPTIGFGSVLPSTLPTVTPNQTEIWQDLHGFELRSRHEHDNFHSQVRPRGHTSISKRGLAGNVQLRIMPLGASIVAGDQSSDHNGFRYALRNKLIWEGNPVNMVGSQQWGTMADGSCECYSGNKINEVASKSKVTWGSKPNLVLIHVGTNDCAQNDGVATAHDRLGQLIEDLFSAIPEVTIIASTLLPNKNANTQANVKIYNGNIPGMISAKQSAGKKVLYVDFSSSWFSTSDLIDDTHPNDYGYTKMAAVWYQGIVLADQMGWLKKPADGVNDVVLGGNTCWKIPGNAIGPVKTQQGSGQDDGAYKHVGVFVGGFAGFKNPASVGHNNPLPEGVYWADINGDGIDDYVYVSANANMGFGVALSTGGGNLGDYLWFAFGGYCLRRGVRFADMTGDGRDDLCCLAPSGDLDCWQNTPGSDARAPNFVSMGRVKTNEGYPQANVRLADIDGDGRADYVAFDFTETQVWGWRNGATSNVAPAYWYKMRGVISGLPKRTLSGWRFVDLNGDKRDDLVWVDETGQVTTWINQRGYKEGLTPVWQSMGITHAGMGIGDLTTVAFGKFMGSGRSDYSVPRVSKDTNEVVVDRYRNDDTGGTKVKGDGTRFCDMTGNLPKRDDYLWILSTGAISLYENEGNWGYWKPWNEIINVNRNRREVHFADFDGDGKCDIMLVDKGTGATRVLKNNYANGKFSFPDIGIVTGSAFCSEGYGNDMHDNGVRWHDLDGDGRADFLCVRPDGHTTAWLNRGNGNMVPYGQVKKSEGKERKNLRFADIDGDGKVDMIWLDMIMGRAEAWKNNGIVPNGGTSAGSTFNWDPKGAIALGVGARGSAIEFANLYGIGRADYIAIDPQANSANTWFNVCPDGGITPVSPNLPANPPALPNQEISVPTPGGPWDKCGGEGYWSMEELETDKDDIPEHCRNTYIAQVLYRVASKALEEYEKLMKDDYQKKFDYYAKYILELSEPKLDEFLTTNASYYFDCVESTIKTCCNKCTGPECVKNCGAPPLCGSMNDYPMDKCPTTIPHDYAGAPPYNEVRYNLQTGKENILAADILKYQGIDPEWWYYGKRFIFVYKFGMTPPEGCCIPCTDPADREKCTKWYYNIPTIDDTAEIKDPEDVFTDAIPKLKLLVENLGKAVTELYDQTFKGNTADVIRGAEYAVAMLTQGVDTMNGIVESSSQIAEIKKKEQIAFIVGMITALIGFVPFAGQSIRALGLVAVGRIITYLGEVTQVALNLYAWQSDKSSPANLMFVIIDALTIYTPRWNIAANAFDSFRGLNAYKGLQAKELARSQSIDRVIIKDFRYA